MIIGEFCDTFPPELDGVGRVTQAYCKTLTEMGHEVYYVAPKHPDAEPEDEYKTILSPSVKMPTELYTVALPIVGSKYRREIKEVPFEIVHAQSPFTAGMEAARIAKKLKIPLVATFHSKYYDDALRKTHSETLAKLVVKAIVDFYEKCDAVWTVNEGTKKVLEEYGYDGKILVMENGTNIEKVDEKTLKKMEQRVGKKDGELTLLFVGQHNYKKNLHGVLGAARILKEEGVKFKLVTAGEGPDFKKIVEEAEELGIASETKFLGFVADKSELNALYKLSDLLVFPSLYDNAPMVLREAAAQGTAGLLVKGSCSAEGLKDGETALIAEDTSAKKIAEKILERRTELKKIGERAKKTIPVSWGEIMKKVVNEYEKLIEKKKKEQDFGLRFEI